MEKLRFNARDVALLYSFPKSPSDLLTLIRCFTFINRVAPPTYDEVTSCLTKATEAGIVHEDGGRYVVRSDWYDRVHRDDATAANEIESMLAFEERFANEELERIARAAGVPSEAEYASVLRALG